MHLHIIMLYNGHLPYYYQDEHTWEEYLERLTQFFLINDFNDDKKKKLLLDSITRNLFRKINNDNSDTVKNKNYNELLKMFTIFFGNGTSYGTTMYRSRLEFYMARQNVDESISDWLKRIMNLMKFCKFACDHDHEQIVLDKFISGMRSSEILDVLLEQKYPMELEKITEIAINEELLLEIKKKSINE